MQLILFLSDFIDFFGTALKIKSKNIHIFYYQPHLNIPFYLWLMKPDSCLTVFVYLFTQADDANLEKDLITGLKTQKKLILTECFLEKSSLRISLHDLRASESFSLDL